MRSRSDSSRAMRPSCRASPTRSIARRSRPRSRSSRSVQASIDGEGAIRTFLARRAAVEHRSQVPAAPRDRHEGLRARLGRGLRRRAHRLLRPLAHEPGSRQHLLERLVVHGWDETEPHRDPTLDAPAMVQFLEERIAKRKAAREGGPRSDLHVEGDRRHEARSRSPRRDVQRSWEAEGLYRHEVETHAYTRAQRRGAEARRAPQVGRTALDADAGGPRRLRRALSPRARGTAAAAPRAARRSWWRWRRTARASSTSIASSPRRRGWRRATRTSTPRESSAAGRPRAARRSRRTRATSPVSSHVHAFLAAFVRAGFRDECEMLVCGRFALEDIGGARRAARDGDAHAAEAGGRAGSAIGARCSRTSPFTRSSTASTSLRSRSATPTRSGSRTRRVPGPSD